MLPGGKYHNLSDYFQISNLGKELEYKKWEATRLPIIEKSNSIFDTIDSSDLILHFPYQSYDYILQFFNQAAIDPNVTNISVTFYRMAENSVIGDALISAANNGKKVSVFIEVKARFDEANNLIWADKMREAGIKMIYSMPGLKVHAKVALIKRKTSGRKSRYYGFFGTGNLNESTAKIYSDHGLLTKNEEMTGELSRVFKYLHKREEPGTFKHLIVSQFGALDAFTGLIDREIENANNGKKSKIIIKLNNLQETTLIDKIYEAASQNVEVTLIIRGICCLVPRTGIKVIRVVDRYLEHARIFYFWNDSEEDLRMGSSDRMNRNLHRRIEVTFPIYDKKIKRQVIDIINIQMVEDAKSVQLDESMNNVFLENPKIKSGAQERIYEYISKLK